LQLIKKILVGSIAALCCLLIGLLVLFFYLNISVNKKNSILSYIPTETQFILRIQQTSKTTNSFFSNQIITDCFDFGKIITIWNSIDSVTSRNYKTSEVLLKNTSYICIDSSGQYLILVDLNKKANEHFIDQFLVNSTSLRKIEKFKEGYKAFYPEENKPLYYFVKNNVFAVSSDAQLILSSLQHGQTEKSEVKISEWDKNSQSDITFWGLDGSEQKILKPFGADLLIGSLNARIILSTYTEVDLEKLKLTFKGTIAVDTETSELSIFYSQSKETNNYFYQADSGIWENRFYSLQLKDSIGNFQPLSFVYSSFLDSGGVFNSLLVTESAIALSNFQIKSLDSSVQIIQMADDNIKQIAVFDVEFCKNILPVIPFNNDSSKLFATIYKGKLFIANSTETILKQATIYPGKNFAKKKLEAFVINYFQSSRISSRLYRTEYTCRLVARNTISFTSEVKEISNNK